jgi:hypothetical protein
MSIQTNVVEQVVELVDIFATETHGIFASEYVGIAGRLFRAYPTNPREQVVAWRGGSWQPVRLTFAELTELFPVRILSAEEALGLMDEAVRV